MIHHTTSAPFYPSTNGREFDISIRDANGTQELYQDFKLESIKFLKPKSPQNLTFLWEHDKVIIEYKPPFSLHCFILEYQYKSDFAEDWFRKNESCKFEIQSLDPAKCYSFQFRARFRCSSSSYPSEWGPKIHWKNGSSIDSCETDEFNPDLNIILQSSLVMAGLLIMTALLLYICRLKKIRKTLMPAIPDPKNIYSDLFRDHNGNFQEWITKTENVLPATQVECIEKECIIEEEKEEDLQKAKMEAKVCQEFTDIFSSSLGEYKGPQIALKLDPMVTPIRIKPRRVPFGVKSKIDAELDKLVE
ncbi:cytokine receptor-like factor 2 [Crotalus tigris]|uniref:cytokine receptor-like factor 2 n=1 Tax=Crotalus tigris TaxID=88082 RepID=UPI00192F93DC|nr:cytokine receptor-like factor 2 [Crotalus tigris]